jgi:hypothetical protein
MSSGSCHEAPYRKNQSEKKYVGGGNFSQSSEYKNGLPRPLLEYNRVLQPDKYTCLKGAVNGLTGYLCVR